MKKLLLLAALVIVTFAGCKAKPPAQKVPRSRSELYKPLPTPAAPKAVPGHPTPKRALPD